MKDINTSPERDAGMGLVYRLNNLWSATDYHASIGEYDKWNWLLDRIFCNLSYRSTMEDVEDDEGHIIKMKYSKKDIERYNFLCKGIHFRRRSYRIAVRKGDKRKLPVLRSRWFHAVQQKDIWLRTLMNELKLYLKEFEKAPGTAAYGTLGQQ